MTGKLDLKTWVQRSNTAHEGFYDYSSSEYKGMLKKIKLTCPLHGEIEQKAVDHSIGRKPSCCRPPKLNLKTWIDRSNKAHNGFYDYTNSKYNGIKEKITFLCPLHGEIEQFADNHSKGHKPSCCRPPKLNLKTWIDRSNKAHNGFYDYTNSKYNGIKEKITFLCPLHGEIEQGAEPHSIGMKPSCCAVNGKVDFKSWAERSNNTHDGFYDYTNSKYEGMREKITFICPLHGEVEQIAGNHSRGHKPSCCSIRGKVEFNTWKERSNEAHDGFYDYSQSEYHGISKKIKLKCPLHGEVEQYADNHSKGHVPSCCKGSKISNAKAGNREDFIKNAKLLFGDKFDYDNVSYIRSRIPVIIGCPKHGQIKMTPNSHLTSVTGCMQCGIDSRSSKLKFSKNKFIQQSYGSNG